MKKIHHFDHIVAFYAWRWRAQNKGSIYDVFSYQDLTIDPRKTQPTLASHLLV